MKILASADLHGHYDVYRWIVDLADKNKVAAVVLAGDLLGCPDDTLPIEKAQMADAAQVLSIIEPLEVPVFYIMGNDDMVELLPSKNNFKSVQGKRVEFGGFNFVGYPYTLPFMGGIFEKPEEEMEADLLGLERLLDGQTILVTHGPAKGIRDTGMLGLHAGSKSLLELLNRRPVRAHVHGHIHGQFGRSRNHFNVASAGMKRCMIIDLSNMKHQVIQDPQGRLTPENAPPEQPPEEKTLAYRVASSISSEMSDKEIKQLVLGICLDVIPAEGGYVGLFAQQEGLGESTTISGVYDKSSDSLPRPLRIVLFGYMAKYREPLRVNAASEDPRFSDCDWSGMPLRSILAVPLMIRARLVGFISLFNKKAGDFTDQDQKQLYLIGALSAQAIVSVHLVADYREDLRAAQLIQQNLLPKEMPKIPGFEVVAAMVPAKMVGGDYFDVLSFSEGRFAFALADVAGKGLPAALLMSNLQAIMRSQAVNSSSCCECIANVNRMLLNLPVPDGRFITLFLALLDPSSKELSFCNAGHNPPILFRPDESVHKLSIGGRLLGVQGVSNEFPHDEGRLVLSGGDVLVIYSDGVIEAPNEAGEMFEENRLLEAVNPHRCRPASDILSAVTESVRTFAGKISPADDLTLMVIKAL